MKNPIKLLLNTEGIIEIKHARIIATLLDSQVSLFKSNKEVRLTFIDSLSIKGIERILEVAKIMEAYKDELLKLYDEDFDEEV